MSKQVSDVNRLAALGDIRKAIEIAAEIGELDIIEGADSDLEMGALYELSLQKPTPLCSSARSRAIPTIIASSSTCARQRFSIKASGLILYARSASIIARVLTLSRLFMLQVGR